GKHFHLDIADTSLTVTRNRERIDAEAALDGIYTLRTTASADELGTAAVIDAYKNLSRVERDFRSLKAIDLDLRPIHHRLTDRVKAHVLICMLAAYLTWHLRQAWAPLTYTDE
ncbi:transposase, partial [Rhodococcus sp. WS4]